MKAMLPKLQEHSIVLLGNFNPKIFQPMWLAAEGLLTKEEAEKAEIAIIHPDFVDFSLDWFKFQVTSVRFTVSTLQEPYEEQLRDLVAGIFDLLRHTPVSRMGINREMHFSVENEEKWHNMGHQLVPKDLWKEALDNPGMRALVMEESVRRDGLYGHVQVKVEPSVRFRPGIFFSVNDHFEIQNPATPTGCEEIILILRDHWEESRTRSREIIFSLMKRLT